MNRDSIQMFIMFFSFICHSIIKLVALSYIKGDYKYYITRYYYAKREYFDDPGWQLWKISHYIAFSGIILFILSWFF